MSNRAILEKAIKKAIDGGWDVPDLEDRWPTYVSNLLRDGVVEALIFNHNFAKSLWGRDLVIVKYTLLTDPPKIAKSGQDMMQRYQYHLQQMVVSEDPIKYLGANI